MATNVRDSHEISSEIWHIPTASLVALLGCGAEWVRIHTSKSTFVGLETVRG